MSRGPSTVAITIGGSSVAALGLSSFAAGGPSLYGAYLVSMSLQFVVFLHASGILFGNTPTERYYDLTG